MYKGKHWRPKRRTLLNDKKNTNGYYWEDPNDPRSFEENEFYTTKGNSGTIEQEKPKMLTIPEIKDKRTAAERRVDDLTNVHLDTIVNGGTDSQIYVAKQNLDNAKKEVENYDLELTAAYGLGPNGYWNRARELDTIVNEAGHKPVSTGQKTTPPTVQPKTSTAPMTNAELDNLVNNPQGYKPQTRQTREVKPKTTTTATPSTKSTVPATHLDLVIAQTLDEFVNNPGMSENRKDELNTQLSKLTADRDVLRWKAQQSGRPTIENYETQEKYVTNEKNFALDDIVNGHGNGSLVEGTDEWYAAHKKVSDLDEQLRALSMGKMGQLDGEKAVSAEEQVAVPIFFEGEESLTERNSRLIDSISQYFWDKSNRNISPEEFSEKYPYGDDYIKVWRRQLAEIIGEERTDDFIKSCENIEVGREKMQAKVEALIWNELPQEEKDRTAIEPALEIIVDSETIGALEDANTIAQIVLDRLNNNHGFTNEKQEPTAFTSNPIYLEEIGKTSVEMEVLTQPRTRKYGGKGIPQQESFIKLLELIPDLANPPLSYIEAGEAVAEQIADIIIEGVVEQYNIAEILQEDDVRISVQTEEYKYTDTMYHYFFRDGQLMFVIYGEAPYYINEDFIKDSLKEGQE